MEQRPTHLKLRDVPTLILHVGPDETAYHVHQDLLFSASKVFKAAFSGKFRESSDRSMSLPDDDVEAFESMTRWLYTQKLELSDPITAQTSSECYWKLAKLNTLADKYDITTLKNLIVDKLFELSVQPKYVKPPQMDVITYVYQNTTEKSSFRKLIVAWYTWNIDFKWYTDDITRDVILKLPEFTADLAISLALRTGYHAINPLKGRSSNYHEKPAEEVVKKNVGGVLNSTCTA